MQWKKPRASWWPFWRLSQRALLPYRRLRLEQSAWRGPIQRQRGSGNDTTRTKSPPAISLAVCIESSFITLKPRKAPRFVLAISNKSGTRHILTTQMHLGRSIGKLSLSNRCRSLVDPTYSHNDPQTSEIWFVAGCRGSCSAIHLLSTCILWACKPQTSHSGLSLLFPPSPGLPESLGSGCVVRVLRFFGNLV